MAIVGCGVGDDGAARFLRKDAEWSQAPLLREEHPAFAARVALSTGGRVVVSSAIKPHADVLCILQPMFAWWRSSFSGHPGVSRLAHFVCCLLAKVPVSMDCALCNCQHRKRRREEEEGGASAAPEPCREQHVVSVIFHAIDEAMKDPDALESTQFPANAPFASALPPETPRAHCAIFERDGAHLYSLGRNRPFGVACDSAGAHDAALWDLLARVEHSSPNCDIAFINEPEQRVLLFRLSGLVCLAAKRGLRTLSPEKPIAPPRYSGSMTDSSGTVYAHGEEFARRLLEQFPSLTRAECKADTLLV